MSNNVDHPRYLEILEISENASSKTLRKAFLRACKKHHTDMGGDVEKFYEVVKAYKFLHHLYERHGALTMPPIRTPFRIRISKGVVARLIKSRASALAGLERANFVFMN